MQNIKRKPIAQSIVLVQYSVNVMISCIRETEVSGWGKLKILLTGMVQ